MKGLERFDVVTWSATSRARGSLPRIDSIRAKCSTFFHTRRETSRFQDAILLMLPSRNGVSTPRSDFDKTLFLNTEFYVKIILVDLA